MYYKTSGESHGPGIMALIEGFPAGFHLDSEAINLELKRRQGGYGRGGRQQLETDRVEFLSGVWQGQTTGAPITLWVKNKDNRLDDTPEIPQPRPGHVDLAGVLKYKLPIRPIMERASARETAGRVAAGAVAAQWLRTKGIHVFAFVRSIGPSDSILKMDQNLLARPEQSTLDQLIEYRSKSELYTIWPEQDSEFKAIVDQTTQQGDSLGGVIEIRAFGVPAGLGSHVQWDEKLDANIARAVMSVQAIKGIEFGLGFESAFRTGSKVHDPIQYQPTQENGPTSGFTRPTNHAGGIEGGISNGMPIIVRAAMKPIPTLLKPLESVDLNTKESKPTIYERSDVCAVPAASVVLENVIAFEIARHYLEATAGGLSIP